VGCMKWSPWPCHLPTRLAVRLARLPAGRPAGQPTLLQPCKELPRANAKHTSVVTGVVASFSPFLLQSLAAEVVRLEESVLRLRSQEIRVGREAEGATEVMRAMQVGGVSGTRYPDTGGTAPRML